MKHAPMIGLTAVGIVLAGAALGSAPEAPRAAHAPAPALAGAFKIDTVHSFALFRVKHMNVSYSYGRFNKIEGSFLIDPTKTDGNSVDVTIQTDSVDTNNEARDKHLKSTDFFSAKEFPTMHFVGTSFKKSGDNAVEVTGDLTLHGKTKSITVTIDSGGTGPGMRGGGEVSGAETKFTIKRSDFGMNGLVGPVGDEVTIVVSLEGGRS